MFPEKTLENYYERGVDKYKDGKYYSAIQYWLQCVELKKYDSSNIYNNVLYNIGTAYLQLKLHDKSLIYYNKIDLNNNNSNFLCKVYYNIAVCYVKKSYLVSSDWIKKFELYKKALEYFLKAKNSSPTDRETNDAIQILNRQINDTKKHLPKKYLNENIECEG